MCVWVAWLGSSDVSKGHPSSSGNPYPVTQGRIRKDLNLQQNRCGNLKCRIVRTSFCFALPEFTGGWMAECFGLDRVLNIYRWLDDWVLWPGSSSEHLQVVGWLSALAWIEFWTFTGGWMAECFGLDRVLNIYKKEMKQRNRLRNLIKKRQEKEMKEKLWAYCE